MQREMISLCVLMSCLYSSASAFAQNSGVGVSITGIIEGRVINEKGEPVAEALVDADDGQPTIGAVRYVPTDANGHFAMDRLKWGHYKIFAQKVEEGYADISFAFYGNNVFETASISPLSSKAAVTVQIGPPCGLLHLVSVTDTATGEKINASVNLRRASNPNLSLGVSASSGTILVPSLTDILVEVSAKKL